MNAPSCSHTEAERQVLEVFRQLHPEWVDASGGCQACLLYSMELAAGTALAASELVAPPEAERVVTTASGGASSP